MSTAISDITTSIGTAGAEICSPAGAAEVVLGRPGAAPGLRRAGSRSRALSSGHRSAVHRRPHGARPGGGAVVSDGRVRTSALRPMRGTDPMRRVERAQVGFAVLAVTALLTAFVVAGLIALAHVRAGDWDGESGGAVPAVVGGYGDPDGAGSPSPR